VTSIEPPRRRPVPQHVYRRRRLGVLGGLAVLLGVVLYLPVTLLAPVKAESAVLAAQPYEAPTATQVPFPGYGAGAVTAEGWGTLGSVNVDEVRSIASITKVVTALVVLEAKPIAVGEEGPTVTMTAADTAIRTEVLRQNAKVLPVTIGQSFTERDLLEMTLVHSAANYAISLADWAFGSEAAFADAADAWLDANGLESTTIVEPTGLDPGNTSTAADLLELGAIALDDPVVAEIVGTADAVVSNGIAVENSNQLLGARGVDGIKTGSLAESGACLLYSAHVTVGERTIRIIGVQLGGPDHDTLAADVGRILDTVGAGFREVPLAADGQAFADYAMPWGSAAQAVATEPASTVVWSDTPVTVAVDAAPIGIAALGAPAGTATFTAGTETVEVPLELSADIVDPGPWWRITNPGALG
jgi:serine-type D-Ala-D-Ala carboxypeptidase (penicillin-binding protein 5/6)